MIGIVFAGFAHTASELWQSPERGNAADVTKAIDCEQRIRRWGVRGKGSGVRDG